MADGASLLFLRPQTANQGSLQPAAEACIHLRGWPGSALGTDRHCNVEARAVLVGGVADGWVLSCVVVGFPDHVRDVGVRVRTFGDGGPSWLEQLRLHVDGMEKGPGIRLGVVVGCGGGESRVR